MNQPLCRHTEHDYWLFIQVLNKQGERMAQRDAPLRANDHPTTTARRIVYLAAWPVRRVNMGTAAPAECPHDDGSVVLPMLRIAE
ncbi:MAG: hypothetical protein HC914_05295 [Chloroflexaceae bacterium]|nr:hypothetical protein [Chloroflexaceae bacterium]